jgi:hypothetical protein
MHVHCNNSIYPAEEEIQYGRYQSVRLLFDESSKMYHFEELAETQ